MGGHADGAAPGDLWRLDFDDLLAPESAARGLGESAPYVIELSSSNAPHRVPPSGLSTFDHLQLYQLERREHDGPRYSLRLGPINSELDADAVLASLREHYPRATTATAGEEDLREIGLAGARRARLAESPASIPAPEQPQGVTAKTASETRQRRQAPQPAVQEYDKTWPANGPPGDLQNFFRDLAADVLAPLSGSESPNQTTGPRPAAASTAPAAKRGASATNRTAAAGIAATVPGGRIAISPALEIRPRIAPPPASAAKSGAPVGQPRASIAPSAIAAPAKTAGHERTGTRPQIGSVPAMALGNSGTKSAQSAPSAPAAPAASNAEPRRVADPSAPLRANPVPNYSDATPIERPATAIAVGAPSTAAAEPAAKSTSQNPQVAPASMRAVGGTQTMRSLTAAELADDALTVFVVHLWVSEDTIRAENLPNLGIFRTYTPYSATALENGRLMHALRLGFFSDEVAAEMVARYLAGYFEAPRVERMNIAERKRFANGSVPAR